MNSTYASSTDGFEEWYRNTEMAGWTEAEYRISKLAWNSALFRPRELPERPVWDVKNDDTEQADSLIDALEARIAHLESSLAKSEEAGIRKALEAVRSERLTHADRSESQLANVAYSSCIEDCESAIVGLLSGEPEKE